MGRARPENAGLQDTKEGPDNAAGGQKTGRKTQTALGAECGARREGAAGGAMLEERVEKPSGLEAKH